MIASTPTRLVTTGLLRIHRRLATTAALACAAFVFGSVDANAQGYNVDFESSTKASYGSGTVTLNGLQWNMTEALIGTDAADFKNGTKSVRFRGYATSSMTMLENKANGAGVVSFLYRRYGTDAQQPFALEFSSDSGLTWYQVGENFTAPASNDVQTFSRELNVPGNVRIRIVCKGTGTSNRRLNIDDLSITDFASSDATPPSILTLAPANGATAVAVTTGLTLEFDENVFKGTGDIVVVDSATGTPYWTIPVADAAVVVSGASVSITLPITPSVLQGNTTYHVTIAAGAFKDAAGNGIPAIADSSTWSFTTGSADTTPPSLLSQSPTAAEATVLPTADLVLTFDEDMQAGSGSVEIRNAADNSLVQSVVIPSDRIAVSGTTVTINPAGVLAFGTNYTIAVSAGAFADLSGNPSAAIEPSSFYFTTRAAPPVVISQYYEGLASDRYIELRNTTDADLPLDGYALAAWPNNGAGGSEGWKSGTNTTTRVDYLDGYTIPAGGHFLVANPGAVAPPYAASNYDYQVVGGATFIDGNDSVVLYFGTGFSQAEIEDAVSFSAIQPTPFQGADISFRRLDLSAPGFDFDPGSSVLSFPAVWAGNTLAVVASAAPTDDWYLSASRTVQDLGLTLSANTVAENAGPAAITATVTRTGSTAEDLFVIIESSDLYASVIFPGYEVTIPAGQASATFTIDVIDDAYLDGNKSATITVTADGFVPASQTITVTDDATDLPYPIVINEVNVTPSTDEFIELYNDSDDEIPLDGLLLVLYNGNGDVSYLAKDLSGYVIPARGFFVFGNASISGADIADLSGGTLQDGADAVALIIGKATDFPNASPVGTINGILLDALVYGTNDANDAGLLAALAPSGVQVNESTTAVVSMARIPDGGAAFDALAYVPALPTPGSTNDPSPEIVSSTPLAGATEVPLNTSLTITFSEPVVAGSGLISLQTAGGNPVALIPSDDAAVSINGATVSVSLPGLLDYATAYYVNLSAAAFIDLTGNPTPAIEDEVSWTFTTTAQDLIAPSVLAYTPVPSATGVSPTANLQIQFDEPIFAGTGSVNVHAADGTLVESIDVLGAQIVTSGDTATINPSVVLEYGAIYYVNYAEGVFLDGGANTVPAVTDNTTWSFTTLGAPSVVISQYYEGLTTADRFIELRNLTGADLSLAGYRLATWVEEPVTIGGRQGWKAGDSSTTRVMALDAYTIPANGNLLIAATGAAVPAYAAVNFDALFDVPALVSEFSGDDSVVLYQGSGFTLEEVVDAVSFSGNQGANKSFARIADTLRGFDFAPGTSILDYPSVWQEVTLADVAAAAVGANNYLTASAPPKVLTLQLSAASVSENAGTAAVTATLTRGGSLAADLVVAIAVSNSGKASAPGQVTIPAGQTSATFDIDIINNAYLDGNLTVAFTASATDYVPGSAQLVVQDDGDTAAFPVVINEVEADSPGTDVAEFIELYNASSDPVSLGGVVLVLFNGSNDTVYSALDLSAHTIPANGFFLIGSTGMANAAIQLAPGSGGWLQNGQDAVALYFGSPANFALNTTFVTDVTNTLIDALVYDTADPDDIDLLNSLTPGGVQVDEAGAGNSANHAIARVPDGGAAFNTASYVLQAPTPGTTNQIAPVIRTQPAASTIDGGNTASMSVAALGGQLSYQWYQGAAGTTTTPVGTNSATLVTPALNATSSFWVRVSNPYGSVDSTAAVVTVNTVAQPPLITTQPASTTIQSGATTVLTVGADGQGQSLTFAWYQGASGDTSVPVGTNSASFTTPALTETTSYWVRVTSAGGSVDSSAATITVETPVPSAVIASFTASPTTIDAGGSSTLSWSVTGAASLSINNGVGNVTGSTSTSVSPTSTTTYTLTATNSANESVTATVTVTVNTTTEDHPAFKVTSIDITGTQLSLTWESQPGAGYIVEVSDNPADAQSWAPLLSSVSSQGASTAVAADLANTAYAGSAKLFFRVKAAAP